jgi:thiosulfate/3-mercaptopyruvate sulfurtransferase
MRLFLLASLFTAQGVAVAQSPTIVSTEWLARNLGNPRVVVVHAMRDSMDYAAGHIPGARPLLYDSIRVEREGIGTELPPIEHLQRTFERLGISDDSHVIIYSGGSNMAPVASRVFLSLDYIGHPRVSILSGGLNKWRAENRSVSTEEPSVAPGKLTPKPREVSVTADFVQSRIGKAGVAFIDTRTRAEYLGTSQSPRLPSVGHIAGARQLEWQQLFRDTITSTFLDEPEIRKLFADRMSTGDTVITYCLVGYRASMTYFAARMLGLPARIYDGSYQDWARRQLPTKKGAEP